MELELTYLRATRTGFDIPPYSNLWGRIPILQYRIPTKNVMESQTYLSLRKCPPKSTKNKKKNLSLKTDMYLIGIKIEILTFLINLSP